MKTLSIIMIIALIFCATRATDPKEIQDVIEGILVGAFGEEGKLADQCINDGEEVFQDIKIAVEDFEKGGAVNIAEGLFYIGKALELLPNELKECGAAKDLIKDFEKIAAEFKNPEALVIHVGEEILWHGKSIYADITDCSTQFKAANYEPAGEDIGDIIKIIFMDDLADIPGDMKNFLEGFFNGSLHEGSVNITDCIDENTELVNDIKKIVKDLKEGGVESFEKFCVDIGQLFLHIPPTIKTCAKVPQDLKKYEQWFNKTKDFQEMEKILIQALLHHRAEIEHDLTDFVSEVELKHWKPAGFDLGDFFYILFEVCGAILNGEDPKPIIERLLKA